MDKENRALNLSKRESEVAELILKGLNSQEIADRLHISLFTVKAHRRSIYKKMNCKNVSSFIYKLKNEN